MVGRPLNKKIRRLSTDSEGDDDSYHVSVPPMKAHSRHGTRNILQKFQKRYNSLFFSIAVISVTESSKSFFSTTFVTASQVYSPPRLTVKISSKRSSDALAEAQILEGKRSRSNKKSYIPESESEADSEIPDLGNDDEEDEDADADIDIDMELDNVELPPLRQSRSVIKRPGGVKTEMKDLTSAPQKHKYVQHNVSEEDELSGLGTDPGEEEREEATRIHDRGERGKNDLVADEDDEEIDSDNQPDGESLASALDLNKLTRRQRARFEEGDSGHLMALPDEVQVKKHLTAEEHAMRRAEMARRRKNLSEKRNEEEKLETINKLLKKQAPKTNNRRREVNIATGGDGTPDITEIPKANPMFVRWVSNKDGNRIGVPEEWIEGPVGAVFRSAT
ncbi:hypothetical protein GcM1_240058 [Golovinomyces cichoracearum]|uniref:INO80 complex subunit B-like conserved region domain-containing protein n=1 Tax=Golovinomyces cichoracearum TaxID=62708 RepID=A0A420II69_9PEZI|nr:hypothetical protein GcM1_240058 [Golovinomyces cichoracearum]